MDFKIAYKNHVINDFLKQNKITESEYNILFCDKDDWSKERNSDNIDLLNKTLDKVINLQVNLGHLKLDYIRFYNFVYIDTLNNDNIPISFDQADFVAYTNFGNANFKRDISFKKTTFRGESNFGESVFKGSAIFFKTEFHIKTAFYKTHFHEVSDFRGCHFQDDVFFWITIFEKKADFVGAVFESLISFGKSSFNNLDLINVRLNVIDFLETTGWRNGSTVTFTKLNIENKETARLIKSNFEKQNNITE